MSRPAPSDLRRFDGGPVDGRMPGPSAPEPSPVIGIDIGGSKVAAALVDAAGNPTDLQTVAVPTRDAVPNSDSEPADSDPSPLPGPMMDPAAIDELLLSQIERLSSGPGPTPAAIGIGAAGWIDTDQVIRFSPHLPWREDRLAARLAARSPVPLRLVNDAKAAAWAEHRFGAGAGARTLLMVTLGTGIGGALVRDGELLLGRNGMAGEFGHMVVVPDGRRCQCGNRGCWEQYASGNALVDLARGQGVGGEEAGPATTAAARGGDPKALALLSRVGRWLGFGLANLTAAFDPDRIVIGGGLGEAGELLLGPARDTLAANLPGRGHRIEPELVSGLLGNRAGLIGAADLARRTVAARDGSTTLER